MGTCLSAAFSSNVMAGMEAPAFDFKPPISNYATISPSVGLNCFFLQKQDRVLRVVAPVWMPIVGWGISTHGYAGFYSRATRYGIKRGAYLHREVMRFLLGRPLAEDERVHHMDSDKGNCAPGNLLLVQSAIFNPSPVARCPYSGTWMSREQWLKDYGGSQEMPNWVKERYEDYID